MASESAQQAALTMGAIAVCIQTPGAGGAMGLPVLLWGPPGVGKTARINQLAASLGFHLTTVLASIRGPEDFLGLPAFSTDPTTGERVTIFVPPSWARDLVKLNPQNIDWYTRRPGKPLTGAGTRVESVPKGGLSTPKQLPSLPPGLPRPGATPSPQAPAVPPAAGELVRGLLFLDEITTAPPRVLAALLRVIHERVVGDVDLPLTTAVLAAANPPEQAVGEAVAPLQAPLANRFVHFDWPEPDPVEWARWMTATAKRAAGLPTVDEDEATRQFFLKLRVSHKAFAGAFLQAAAAATDFFTTIASRRRELPYLFTLPEDEKQMGRSWPSPRSWEIGLRGYAAAISVGAADIARHILYGAVGEVAAAAFLDHLATAALPAPIDVLTAAKDGRPIWLPDPVRGAADFLHVNKIVQFGVDQGGDLAAAAWDFLALLRQYGAALDVIQHGYRILQQAKVPPSPKARGLSEEMTMKLGAAMAAAGIA